MTRTAVVATAAFLTLLPGTSAAQIDGCTFQVGEDAASALGQSRNWDAYYETYRQYHRCVDDWLAESFADKTVRLLTLDGGGLERLAELVEADSDFGTFVIRYISPISPSWELNLVIENTRDCPAGKEAVCGQLRTAAEEAIADHERYMQRHD